MLPPGVALLSLGEHRLKDLGRPETIAQLLHPTLPSSFPPLRSLDNPILPNNLPQQLTTYIGRETEIDAVKALLAKSRLVTLTGIGGAGKTRLSLQVAADLLETRPDGAWIAELAPIADAALVPEVVASALGVEEQPGKTPLMALVERLKDKRLLLLLDNCEHVLDAAARLADSLLRNCPGVQILATSREASGLGANRRSAFPLSPCPT